MIKFITWLFNNIIIGNNDWTKFVGTCNFEEALEMLKKGYFIKRAYSYNANTLYAIIDGTIYSFDLKKKTSISINRFDDESLLNEKWEIIPFSKQVNWRENNNE